VRSIVLAALVRSLLRNRTPQGRGIPQLNPREVRRIPQSRVSASPASLSRATSLWLEVRLPLHNGRSPRIRLSYDDGAQQIGVVP